QVSVSLSGHAGMASLGGISSDVYIFHGLSHAMAQWQPTSDTQAMIDAAGVATQAGRIYVFGGISTGYTNRLMAYDIDPCAEYVTCKGCAKKQTPSGDCAFCSHSGLCMLTDGTDPIDGTCPDLFRLTTDDCPNCSDNVGCATCSADPECGWCGQDGKCVEQQNGEPLYEDVFCQFFEWEGCAMCSAHGFDADACVADGLCGWCEASMSCMEGTADWTECEAGWQFSEYINCGDYTDCGACQAAGGTDEAGVCGWCSLGGQSACMPTDGTDPLNAVCPGTFLTDQCVDCHSLTSCGECTTQGEGVCGFCKSSNQCEFGDSLESYDSVCQDWRPESDVCVTKNDICAEQDDIVGCTNLDECGWCGSDKSGNLCFYGKKAGPLDPSAPFDTCATWTFVYLHADVTPLEIVGIVSFLLLMVVCVINCFWLGQRYFAQNRTKFMSIPEEDE
ncbi:hypothetical protein KIPB_004670, partial [Kipferlia bialata]